MSEPDAPRPYPEGWPMPAEKPDPPPPAPPPPRDVPVAEAPASQAPAVAPREAPTEAPRDAPGDLHEELPGSPEEDYHHPLDRVTGRLPRRTRIVVDWIVTIVGAIAIVLAIKAWVVNPYRIPSSSMEPTLHCARPAPGCEARFSDRVLANRFIFHFRDPRRGEIVVFQTTPAVKRKCNAGGTFVKRIVGLPGETLQVRLIRGREYVYINGRRLEEPYIQASRRGFGPAETFKVPEGKYFMMGDNRASSCDSRVWGSLPRENILGKVFMTYWPPQRISFR